MLLQPENILSTNLFAYCNNNPVIFADNTGYIATNVVGAAIGIVVGLVEGYFLSRFLADKLNLKGWTRSLFIVGITAIITAAAGVIGYFIGKYIKNLGSALMKGIKGIFKPKIGTKIGRLGTLAKNTKPAIKGLTRHGLKRMAERGVSESLAKKL